MDFPYLAKVTRLNIAALAALASAPPPPEPTVQGAVSTDTHISWGGVNGAERYTVRWRRTDSNRWEHSSGPSLFDYSHHTLKNPAGGRSSGTTLTTNLAKIRVDDWVFGVSSVSKDGYESPVASAVPGGAFKPYVAPPPKP